MTRGFLLILILAFSIKNLSAQSIDSVKHILSSNDFLKFDSTCKAFAGKTDSRFNYNLNITREIVSPFNEIICEIEIFTPTKEANVSSVNSYWLYMLRHENTLVYTKMVDKSYNYAHPVLYNYQSDSFMKLFKSNYKSSFDRKISIGDLFEENVTYGSRCGWSGIEIEYRKKLNKIVAEKDINKLEHWLKSPVVEIQVYAIEGFTLLSKNGYILNTKQQKIIQLIKSKKGEIRTCSGCIYQTREISEVIERIEQ
jgi:hypothetical protein